MLLLIENVSSILIPTILILDNIASPSINSLVTVIVSAVILQEFKLILLNKLILSSEYPSVVMKYYHLIEPIPSARFAMEPGPIGKKPDSDAQ